MMYLDNVRVTVQSVRVTIVVVGWQYVLNIMTVCLYPCFSHPASNCLSVCLYHIFQYYLTNGTIFGKKNFECEKCFDFSTTFVYRISHSKRNLAWYCECT